MAIGDPTPQTDRTPAHQRVVRMLEDLGYRVQEEVDFYPYRVDIYIPCLHLAIEVDGGVHGSAYQKRHDTVRDALLGTKYFLTVSRFQNGVSENEVYRTMSALAGVCQPTAERRRTSCELEAPWL